MPKVVRCPNCHAPLTVEDTQQAVIHCQYCGYDAKQTMYAQPRPVVVTPVQPSAQASKNLKVILIVIVATTVLPLLALPAVFCGIGATVTSSIVKTATQPVVVTSGGGGITIRRGASSEPDTEPEADRLLAAKLELASDCLNRNSVEALRARARYLGWVADPKAGPSCSERCIGWGVQKLDAGGENGDLAKLKAATQPPLPFDAAAQRLVSALEELGKVTAEAHRYYDQKDYLEDGCAKARTLHARLVPLFETVEKADAEIRAVLERELPALWARRLKLVEREDPGGQLARSLALLVEARKLVDLIRDREAGRGGDGSEAALRAQIQRFSDAIDKAASGPEGKPLRHPKWIYRVDSWVQSAATDLLKVAKGYARGEHRERLAEWQRLHPLIRRNRPAPDALSPVLGQYNNFLHHLRGAGVNILIVEASRC